MRIRWIIFVLSALVGFQCFATPNPKVLQLTSDQGLINGNIHQIAHDDYGYIWFATENGLVRYDGFNYKTYQSLPSSKSSLSHNFVNTVSPESETSVWVGTMSGVDNFNPLTGVFEDFHFYNANGNVYMKPGIQVCPVGSVCFVRSDDRLLYYCEMGNDTLRPIRYKDFKSTSFVTAFDVISSSLLLAGNKDGIVYTVSKSGATNILFSMHSQVTCIKALKTGSFVICTANGDIKIIDGKTYKEIGTYKISGFDTFITSVAELNNSVLAFGLRSQGVAELSYREGIRYNAVHKLVNKSCSSLCQDSFGNLWVGHSYGGITVRLAQSIDYNETTLPEKLNTKKVLSVVEVGDITYIGTDGDGLCMYNNKTRQCQQYTSESLFDGYSFDDVITSLFLDGEFLWIGTYNKGVFALSTKTGKASFAKQLSGMPEKNISTIFVDSQQNVWIGTYEGGVFVFNKKSKLFERHYTGYEGDQYQTISCNGSTCFYEDSENSIWIGSYYGITKIRRNREITIYRYDKYHGMRSSVVTAITQGKDGRVWFGSLQGMSYYDEKGDTILALQNQQIANKAAVNGIIPQKDSTLVVVTPKLVYVYNPKRNEFQFVSTLDNGEFSKNALSTHGGTVLLGTDKGIKSLVFPVPMRKTSNHPFRLTDLLVQGVSVFSSDSKYHVTVKDGVYYLDLPYNEKNIAISFSDFYFDNTRPRDFVYELKGLSDKKYSLQNNNMVNYSELRGGDYVFTVNYLGNNEENQIELHIHIGKAIWERASFYIILFLLAVTILTIFFVRRMRMAAIMRNRLERQVEMRTKDIQEKTKQIELQNEQIRLQRDAAMHQRVDAEKRRIGIEKRLSILLEKVQENDDLIHDLKQKTISLNKEKLFLKRKIDLFENNVTDVIFKILIPSEKIEYVSPSVVNLTGYESKDFYDSVILFKDLLTDQYKENLKLYRNNIVEGNIPECGDFQIITKSGKVKTIRQHFRYETNLKGTVIALEFLLQDVTEHDSVRKNTKSLEQQTPFTPQKTIVDEPLLDQYDWSTMTILIGDADNQSFEYICECLNPTHITILRSTNGEDVVQKCKTQTEKIDLIIMDIQLPKLNGYEAMQQIRKFNMRIPIIAQTLYGNYEAKLQCFDAGCDTYISKPYKNIDLLKVILKYIKE